MQLPRELLASETNQIGTRDHSKVVEDEDGKMKVGSRISDGDCCWYDRPEDVADSGSSTGRQPAYLEESLNVYATSATFPSGLDACGDATLCKFIRR